MIKCLSVIKLNKRKSRCEYLIEKLVESQYGHAAVMLSELHLLPLGNWEGGVSDETESEELPRFFYFNPASDRNR